MLRETKSFKLILEKVRLYNKVDLFIKNKNINIDEEQFTLLLSQLEHLNEELLLITNDQNDIKPVIFDIFSNRNQPSHSNKSSKNYLNKIKENFKKYRQIQKLLNVIEENTILMDITIDNIQELVNQLPKTEYDIFKENNKYNDSIVDKSNKKRQEKNLFYQPFIKEILIFKMLHLELGVYNLLIDNYLNLTNVEYNLGYYSELDYVNKKNKGILTIIANKKKQKQCEEAFKLLLPILAQTKSVKDYRITRIMAQQYYQIIKTICDLPNNINNDKIYYK